MDENPEIDDTLRKKRKVRELKSCYPCRKRKVKCNNELPCDICIARDHRNLCTYERQNDETTQASSGSEGPSPKDLNKSRNDLSPVLEHSESFIKSSEGTGKVLKPLEIADHLTGETIFLGANSAPAFFLRNLEQPECFETVGPIPARTLDDGNILSVFGLDNSSVTYPFVNLWSTEAGSDDINNLRQALPSDFEIVKALTQFRSTSYLYFPPILELSDFEKQLYSFLSQRQAGEAPKSSETSKLYGKDIAWVGTLYAMLACAAQFDDTSMKERSLASRVFVCLSFQCLRSTNFFQRPSVQNVQTMLLIGNVLQNDLNPGVAWTLLGLTIRSAQSIGVHNVSTTCQSFESQFKRKLWCAMVWQDAILSLSHDRPTTTTCAEAGTSANVVSDYASWIPGFSFDSVNATFEESLLKLCPIVHAILSSRHSLPKSSQQLGSIESLCGALDQIYDNAKSNLRDHSMCTTRPEYIEHLTFMLNLGHARSELCRPVLEVQRHEVESRDVQRLQKLQRVFVLGSWDTIHAFLDIEDFDNKLARTWSAMHRVLSTSVVLCLLTQEERHMDSNQSNGRPDPLERLLPVLEKMAEEDRVASDEGESKDDAPAAEAGSLGKVVEILKVCTRS